MEPFPTFLGIKLDPKLSYQAHLDYITPKIISRTNLIRRVKSLKLKNQTELCLTIFKSQIRSLLDYAFIPIISPTQNIATKLQTLQNRALRTITHFPHKTSTKSIHDHFNLDLLSTRSANLTKKFALTRETHAQLLEDYSNFISSRTHSPKYKTIFEKIPELF